jgi:hypothetical protein
MRSLQDQRKTGRFHRLRTWWLHWEYVPNGINDFAKYIQFDENAEEEFIKEIMKIIKIFELDSNLMTEINSYLNSQESK